MQTLERIRAPIAETIERRGSPAVRVAWQALWTSRLCVLLAGVFGVLSIGRAPGTDGFDPTGLTAPSGYFGNLIVSPLARWDSVWYLNIAHSGYDHQPARAAFYPLYPLAIKLVGFAVRSDLIAGVLISLVAFAVALILLHRLVALELGQEIARVAVLLIAFSPMSYYFSAVYSESLFLALSLGCILCARSGRWLPAGLLGALAAAERATGIALFVPLLVMYLYGPRSDRAPDLPAGAEERRVSDHARWARRAWGRLRPAYRPGWAIGWSLLVPAGLGGYLGGLAVISGDGLSPLQAGKYWYHHFAGPFGGVWDGIVAAWDGLRQLLHGPPPPIYFTQAGGDPLVVAQHNLVQFAFLAVGAIALVGAFRRLPFAYGAYALASLAIPLSYPVTPEPLQSLSRYELVLFPLFMWGAWWVWRRRLTTPVIASMAVLLGLFTVQFATWRFVA